MGLGKPMAFILNTPRPRKVGKPVGRRLRRGVSESVGNPGNRSGNLSNCAMGSWQRSAAARQVRCASLSPAKEGASD